MIQPIGEKVLVRPTAIPEEKQGTLFIPETVQKKPLEGEVVAIGRGKYQNGDYIPTGIKVGDRVVYNKNAGMELKDGNEKFLLFKLSDIIAVVTE